LLRLPAFNFISPFSLTDANYRHGLAIVAAIITHSVLVVLVIVLPSKLPTSPQHVIEINLTFARPLDVPSEESTREPVVDPDPAVPSQPDDPLPAPAFDNPPPQSVADATPASARSTDQPVSAASQASDETYTLRPGTQSVLRGLQCPGDPEAFAHTGICPQDARRSTQIVATEETAADFYTIDLDGIRALYGRAPHALSGQPTLGDGTQRRSLSNADSIRETLPASQPDPAFGD
jgi:hypothetical protein